MFPSPASPFHFHLGASTHSAFTVFTRVTNIYTLCKIAIEKLENLGLTLYF